MQRIYRSKIDSWVWLVLLAAIGVCVYAGYDLARQENHSWWPIMLTMLAGVVLPLWLLADTRYIFETQRLLVRGGPFRWKIPLREITSTEPTRSPVSSPALSLDRIRIHYSNGKSIMVSPSEKQKFLDELEKRRSQLR